MNTASMAFLTSCRAYGDYSQEEAAKRGDTSLLSPCLRLGGSKLLYNMG